MNFKTIGKFFGLSLALVFLALAGGTIVSVDLGIASATQAKVREIRVAWVHDHDHEAWWVKLEIVRGCVKVREITEEKSGKPGGRELDTKENKDANRAARIAYEIYKSAGFKRDKNGKKILEALLRLIQGNDIGWLSGKPLSERGKYTYRLGAEELYIHPNTLEYGDIFTIIIHEATHAVYAKDTGQWAQEEVQAFYAPSLADCYLRKWAFREECVPIIPRDPYLERIALNSLWGGTGGPELLLTMSITITL